MGSKIHDSVNSYTRSGVQERNSEVNGVRSQIIRDRRIAGIIESRATEPKHVLVHESRP